MYSVAVTNALVVKLAESLGEVAVGRKRCEETLGPFVMKRSRRRVLITSNGNLSVLSCVVLVLVGVCIQDV